MLVTSDGKTARADEDEIKEQAAETLVVGFSAVTFTFSLLRRRKFVRAGYRYVGRRSHEGFVQELCPRHTL